MEPPLRDAQLSMQPSGLGVLWARRQSADLGFGSLVAAMGGKRTLGFGTDAQPNIHPPFHARRFLMV
jgi:hypothetical protein